MNATKAELSQLQQQIAAGCAPALPDGKAEEFYWHPTIAGFGLRLYANGSGTWLLQYRNKRGLQRRYKIGSAAVLNLSFATTEAKKLTGRHASGDDPQGAREEMRELPKQTFGALAKRFLDEREPGQPNQLGRHSWYTYKCLLKNHTGQLARMRVDEITPKHVVQRVKEIAKTSPHTARYLRTFVSAVYKWGQEDGLDLTNPVAGTWCPKVPRSKARALSLDELGAVWRALEVMAKEAREFMPVRGGRAGASARPSTGAANSIRADATWLSRLEAARQSGIHPITLWEAINRGQLKATRRRDLPANTDPQTIKQGYSHRSLMIQVGDLNEYVARYHVRTAAGDYSAIIRLLILLGGRYSEVAELRWDTEVNLDKNTLYIEGEGTPEHRGTKNKRDLVLPLSPMAAAIFKEIKRRPGRDFVFGDGPRGMNNSHDMKTRLDALIAKAEGAPLKPWRHHDLRHSATTEMNAMGIDSRVVETITNHWSGHRQGIAGRYNHAMYEKQVKQALEAWAQTVRNIADGVEPDTNVVRPEFGKARPQSA